MNKTKNKGHIEIVLMKHQVKCSKCLHVRINEPYAIFYHPKVWSGKIGKSTCWRCCRDAESTFLIQRKWPLAFDVVIEGNYHRLEWSPGIKAFVEGTGETPKLS